MKQEITEVAQFTERDYELTHFIAKLIPGVQSPIGATHILLTRDGYRFINLLKTVCYVAVDEDDDGLPVWEKWNIKNLVNYSNGYIRTIEV